jgi:hypothetical protein
MTSPSPADRIAEAPTSRTKLRFTIDQVRAQYEVGAAEVPLDATTEQRVARCNAGLKLLGYSRDFVDTLMAHVEHQDEQLAAANARVEELQAHLREIASVQDRIPDTDNGDWGLAWDQGYNAALGDMRLVANSALDRETSGGPSNGS